MIGAARAGYDAQKSDIDKLRQELTVIDSIILKLRTDPEGAERDIELAKFVSLRDSLHREVGWIPNRAERRAIGRVHKRTSRAL